jgi:hypothetical protein
MHQKPTNQLVNTPSEPLLVLGQTTGNTNSLDSSRPGLGGSHHLPPYSILCVTPRTHTRMPLCPGTPKVESQNCPKIIPVWTPRTSRGHNSLLRPPVGTRSEANLYLSLRAFQRCVALPLRTPRSGQFPTFSGRESNCQFDSRPFFCL